MYLEEMMKEIRELGEIAEVAVHWKLAEEERNDIYQLWVKGTNGKVVEILMHDIFGRQDTLLFVLCSLVLHKCSSTMSFDLGKEILKASKKYPYQGVVTLDTTPIRGWCKEMIF